MAVREVMGCVQDALVPNLFGLSPRQALFSTVTAGYQAGVTWPGTADGLAIGFGDAGAGAAGISRNWVFCRFCENGDVFRESKNIAAIARSGATD